MLFSSSNTRRTLMNLFLFTNSIQSPFSLIKTYLNVYIYIHYYKFYRAEFDSKYRSIQKPLPFNKKQTKLYLFYHLESLVEVEWAFLYSPPPSYFVSLRTEIPEYRRKLEMSTWQTSLEG